MPSTWSPVSSVCQHRRKRRTIDTKLVLNFLGDEGGGGGESGVATGGHLKGIEQLLSNV